MTDNRTVVPSLSSVSFIDNLPSGRHSVHDIRLKFKAEGIWSTIRSTHPELITNEVSKDISLLPVRMYNMEAKTVVHHSDTVSVIKYPDISRREIVSIRYRLANIRRHHCHKFIFQTITLGL